MAECTRSVEEVREGLKARSLPTIGIAFLVFIVLIVWFAVIPGFLTALLEDSVGRSWGSLFFFLWEIISFYTVVILVLRWVWNKSVDRLVKD